MQQFPQEQPFATPVTPGNANNRIITEVEVKPTWRLAWGLFWKMFLIGLVIEAVLFIPVLLLIGIAGYSIGS